MKTKEPATRQATELTEHFKAHAPQLRIDTLQRAVDVILAMISASSVNVSDLIANMPGLSSTDAKKRRAERAIRDEQFTMQVFMALILAQLPRGKLLLSLDRTTWEHGQTPMNLLVLGVVAHGYTIPLVWVALDHTGNSDTPARMRVVLMLLRALPARRWKGLVADREFIGAEWFGFLRRQGIRRAVRIRQNTLLDEVRADENLGTLQIGQIREIEEKTLVFGEWMRVVATRSPAGDLVIIATDFGVWETWKLYKQRWSIECTFSSMKSRGFDLERTGVTDAVRLERLFGLMTLAWWCCLRVGVWWNECKPIKVLKHGGKAMSFVRYGSEQLRNALRWNPRRLAQILQVLISPFLSPETQKSEVVRY